MAREEEKSTGDIITLIFKGQKSVEMFVSHFRDKEETGNVCLVIKAKVEVDIIKLILSEDNFCFNIYCF